MPWDITIFSGDSKETSRLGSPDEVAKKIAGALPGSTLMRAPSMPDELLAQMPETVRAMMNQARFEGGFEHPEFSITFFCTAEDVIRTVGAEVRGNGDPMAALRQLCDSTGWSIWDDTKQELVDFSNLNSDGWSEFCKWRDQIALDSQDQDDATQDD